MKTRFDGKLWIGAFGLALEVKDMETARLLNTVKMLVQKPARVQAMMDELEARGVNTENIMELYTKDAAFSA